MDTPSPTTEPNPAAQALVKHRAALAATKSLEGLLSEARASQGEAKEALLAFCAPLLSAALQEFEALGGYRIVSPQLLFSYGEGEAPEAKISLDVTLRSRSGHEPDEEFDGNELEELVVSSLRPIVDRHFADANLPVTLGTVQVPSSYYMK